MKKLLSVLLALAMVLALVPATLAEAYLNPTAPYYRITSEADLLTFFTGLSAQNQNYQHARVELANDLDMTNAQPYTWVTGTFYGIFNGNGHTIYNFDSQAGGLFEHLEGASKVYDLTLENASVKGDSRVGAFANSSAGVLEKCYLKSSSVTGKGECVGGIVGLQCGGVSQNQINDTLSTGGSSAYDAFENDPTVVADSMIRSCETDENCVITNVYDVICADVGDGNPVIEQVGMAGGIAGMTHPGIIEHCVNRATVTGMRPGGILGMQTFETTVRFCTNYGTVVQDESLTNYKTSPVDSRPFYVAVQDYGDYGEASVQYYHLGAGGIVGFGFFAGDLTIQNCMNYGSVSGLVNVGGIAGMITTSDCQIVNCGNDYKESDLQGNAQIDYQSTVGGAYNVGGLVGYIEGTRQSAPGYCAYGANCSTSSIIINSYNAMPFSQGTELTYVECDTIMGGLVGRAGDGITLENCHNAGVPNEAKGEPINLQVSAAAFGSLIGYSAPKCYITHCFGRVDYDAQWMDLIGAYAQGGTYLSSQYCQDVYAYALDKNTILEFAPNEQPNCGGVIVSVPQPYLSPLIYTPAFGSFTSSVLVLSELQSHVNYYGCSYVIDGAPNAYWVLPIYARLLDWFCADPVHGQGFYRCPEYAIFHSLFNGSADSPAYPDFGLDELPPDIEFEPLTSPGPDDPDDDKPGEIISHSLSLEGDIGVNFYVSIPYVSADATADFTFGGSAVQSQIDLNQYTLSGNVPLYKFSCPVNASQISTVITGVVHNHVVNGDQDYWIDSDPFTYTVNEYISTVSQLPQYQSNTALMDLMKSISVYGYYANELFGTEPVFTVSSLFDDSDLATIDAGMLSPFEENNTDHTAYVAYYGSSLLLNSNTTLRIYFSLAAGEAIENYVFRYMRGDEELQIEPTPSGSYYYVEIPNVESKNLGVTYTVRAYRLAGDPIEETLVSEWNCAALSYAFKVLTKAEQGTLNNDNLVNAVKALYYYYLCACGYFTH